MKSMTGFGRGEYRSENLVIDVEIKTIQEDIQPLKKK